ncbi:MAG: acetyl-CoA carboxylase, biotin carboxyl carrier protein [Cyanobacteria bacterium QS_4_48_99]|nr:MAG: acetyl-CoA carboxylase, biotin carboxyl carrier protein [Cyanobacteria bacterium QS_4_48_99]
MPVDFNQIRELIAAINQTDIAELTLKSEDFELTVRKGASIAPKQATEETHGEVASQTAPEPTVTPSANEQSASPPVEQKGVEVTSPMVGTFYRAPAPDEEPFVEVGDRVTTQQTVCIIEAMKLMNEIESEVSGEVTEILVEDGEPVEYGQTLMRIKPS